MNNKELNLYPPNLNRASSLTWGLSWDRTAVLGGGQQQGEQIKSPQGGGGNDFRMQRAESAPAPLYDWHAPNGGGNSSAGLQTQSLSDELVSSVASLALGGTESSSTNVMYPPAAMTKRSVSYGGAESDQHQLGNVSGFLLRSTSDAIPIVNNKRASSDALAVAAAWGGGVTTNSPPHAGGLSPTTSSYTSSFSPPQAPSPLQLAGNKQAWGKQASNSYAAAAATRRGDSFDDYAEPFGNSQMELAQAMMQNAAMLERLQQEHARSGAHWDPNGALEIQIQNLQAMQQQWLTMMQMQMEHKNRSFRSMDPVAPAFTPQQQARGNKFSNKGSHFTSHHAQQQQQQQQQQSTLLVEHKVTGRRLHANELIGHVVEFSRDSHGSRLIQHKMESGTPEEKRMFVDEALPHTLALAKDLFGNYVIQNFFDNADADQRDSLAGALLGSVANLCTHPHGCRVVQRALYDVTPAKRNDLIFELLQLHLGAHGDPDGVVRNMAREAHATHVLQKAIVTLQRGLGMKSASIIIGKGAIGGGDRNNEDVRNQEAFDLKRDSIHAANAVEDPDVEKGRTLKLLECVEVCVARDALPMMVHQQACRVVQRVIGSCAREVNSDVVQGIVASVFANVDTLAIHQNGNFVLQHILENGVDEKAALVQAYVCSNAVKLARHKFGSHLVEKSLSCASPAQAVAIIERFLRPLGANELAEFKDDEEAYEAGLKSALPLLMKDPYANFVVQKAFDVAQGEIKQRLASEIRARSSTLSKFSYGRHILTHINRADGGGEEFVRKEHHAGSKKSNR